MFDELVESSPVKKKSSTPFTIFLSTLMQCFLVGILILVPLIYTEALPKAMLTTLLVAPPPPIPKDVAMIKEQEMPPDVGVVGGVPGGVPGGQAGGVLGGIIGGSLSS